MPALETVDMHTGGEPVRIVVGGYPDLGGGTILEKRRRARDEHDHIRKLLMLEPRGHADMYGVIPVEPDDPAADLGVLFMHNEGYSTMCGHATIAIGRWAVDSGRIPAVEPATTFNLQVPAGVVSVTVHVVDGNPGKVSFRSVPAFVAHSDASVSVPGHGEILLDVAYGGAFYAFADASRYRLDVRTSRVADLVEAAWATTRAVSETLPLSHPDSEDLAFLYGTILTDGIDDGSAPSANICVFAGRQVDRSPTGSGVTARIAIQHARGLVGLGETREFESVVGSRFTGRAVATTRVGGNPAVIVEVTGTAHYTGTGRFTVESDDPLPGFLVG
jgi:proline racemase